MEAKAIVRFLMISPRKARLVADEVRGFSYPEAIDFLNSMSQKAAPLMLKLIRSARANAYQTDEKVKDQGLYVKKLYVDGGPVLKRWRPQSKGRAAPILKRTSHITVVLGTEE